MHAEIKVINSKAAIHWSNDGYSYMRREREHKHEKDD
jgi:hypothetical protein